MSEFALAVGGDEITIPILKPEKLDGIVAIASDYKDLKKMTLKNIF